MPLSPIIQKQIQKIWDISITISHVISVVRAAKVTETTFWGKKKCEDYFEFFFVPT